MPMKEYCFSFDINRCVQCHACETACKVHNNIETGCAWRKIMTFWKGDFPEIGSKTLSISCMHCVDPECMKICPEQAISKNPNGIVLVDSELCSGCRICLEACPVNAPQFGRDGKMQKCDFCRDSIETDAEPACAATCPAGAIRFDIVHESEKIRFEKEMTEYFA